jgi:peptidoglycan/xylan/chitin deacetylase (PgdA/CDA1 family)
MTSTVIKRRLARGSEILIRQPFIKKVLLCIGRNKCTIFTMHRFDLSCYGFNGSRGHDPLFIEQCLLELKCSGHNIVSIDDVFKASKEGRIINNAVVFTIDDGFFDSAIIAEKVFAKHGMPVTIFLVTDFVSGDFWLVESRIRYIIEMAGYTENKISLKSGVYAGKNQRGLERELIWYSKTLTLEHAEALVEELSLKLDISVPQKPPEQYSPLSWDTARRLEGLGVAFGAHTVRHPTLSLESDKVSEFQVLESIKKLDTELKNPSRVFCYPTGRSSDYTQREQKTIFNAGFLGTLSTETDYFSFNSITPPLYLTASRFGFPNSMVDFKQCAFYLEYLKKLL